MNLRVSKLKGFIGGLLLTIAPLLVYSGFPLVGFLLAILGFTALLLFLRSLSRIYDEPMIWFYAKLSTLSLVSGLLLAYLASLDKLLSSPYLLGVTLIPALIDVITFANLSQLFTTLAYYTLLLLAAYSLLRAFTIASIKSREWKLEVVGYSVLVTIVAGSTLLLPIISGFLLVLVSIYGRLREP